MMITRNRHFIHHLRRSSALSPILSTCWLSSHSNNNHHVLSKDGIQLSFILQEFEKISNQSVKNLTTAEVCSKIIIPTTSNQKVSYCDWIKQSKVSVVGKAQVYISHPLNNPFHSTLEALKLKFADKLDTYIWLDIFCQNHHLEKKQIDSKWLSESLKPLIASIGNTTLVYSPWKDATPFARTWCIWEAYCSIVAFCDLDIAMSVQDTLDFYEEASSIGMPNFFTAMTKLNIDQSLTTYEHDKVAIMECINNDENMTVTQLRSILHRRLIAIIRDRLEAMVHKSQATLQQAEDNDRQSRVNGSLLYAVSNTAKLCETVNDLEKADRYYNMCAEVSERWYGNGDTEVNFHALNVLRFYARHEKFRSQPEIKEKVTRLLTKIEKSLLSILSKTSSERQSLEEKNLFIPLMNSFLCDLSTVAGIYDMLKQPKDAKRIYHECYLTAKEIFGDYHNDTISLFCSYIESYASCKTTIEEELELERLWKQCYANLLQAMANQNAPTDQIDVLSFLSTSIQYGYAECLFKLEKYHEAEPYYVHAYDGMAQLYGMDRPVALGVKFKLGKIKAYQGHFADAESLLASYVIRILELYGLENSVSDEKLAEPLSMLFGVYIKQGKLPKAKSMMGNIFSFCKKPESKVYQLLQEMLRDLDSMMQPRRT